MKRLHSIVVGALALVMLAAQTNSGPPPSERTVVIISLDGFPAYALDDPKLPVPTLRRLMREGASAHRMTTVNPTVTWPNHTTLVTGVRSDAHGLLYNGSAIRTGAWPPIRLDPSIDKEQMERAVTIYDLAHRSGLTTAQIDWVAINRAPTITWAFPEIASPEGALEHEMIERGAVQRTAVEQFTRSSILWRDEIWAKAAVYLLREHKPNLLLLHFLSLDSTQHRYGPKTLASQAAMAFLDRSVAEVLNAIEEANLTGRATVFIVSDHGFKSYTKQIRPAVAFAAAGLSDAVFTIPEGGSAMVYLDKKRRLEVAAQVRRILTGMEGVKIVAGPEDFPSLGLPDPDKDTQMPDLIAYANSGYAFSNAKSGENAVVVSTEPGGAHGYINSDPDMDAIFIASGYGIRPGVSLDRIANVDVAPTAGRILGLTLPHPEGRVLTEILR